jgi:hypothetical protein
MFCMASCFLSPVLLVEVVVPVLAQRLEAVEVQLIAAGVLDHQFRGAGVAVGVGLLGLSLEFLVGVRRGVLGGVLGLQNRVLLKFLLDALLQGHDGQL